MGISLWLTKEEAESLVNFINNHFIDSIENGYNDMNYISNIASIWKQIAPELEVIKKKESDQSANQ